jgi:predicted HAD superfamily phosphohydrolase YqeG
VIARHNGWMTTAVQGAPQLIRLARHLRPTIHVKAMGAIDEDFLVHHGVSAILWDVDGTLMPHGQTFIASNVRTAMDVLGRRVPQAILSNCDDDRLLELGGLFAELPVLKGYFVEGGGLTLRRLQGGKDEWSVRSEGGPRPCSRPPGRVRSIRKPSAQLIDLAVEALGADRERVFMIGDQYFTDIAGANLAGIRSVKVDTVAPKSFPLAIRVFQLVERVVYRALYGRQASAAALDASPGGA